MSRGPTFHPHARQSLVEVVRPPEGYFVDAAVGTTYSLDFESLTALFLGFLDLDSEKETDPEAPLEAERSQGRSSGMHALQSLRAIGRFAGTVRIYVNHGGIRPRRHHSEFHRLYDRMVRQVSFLKEKEPSSFHPKVWVIKYASTSRTPACRYRLLVQSRNLTAEHFLDLAIVLEGERTARGTAMGRQLAEFVGHLAKLPQETHEVLPEKLQTLIEELPRVQFACPRHMTQAKFIWNAPRVGGILGRIPSSGRILVMSPFLDDRFIKRLLSPEREPLILISTSRALEGLSRPTFMKLASGGHRLYAIDDDLIDGSEGDEDVSADRTFGLHAKLFLFEDGSGPELLMGSANATMRGFERNCEAMISVKPLASIGQFCAQFLFKDKDTLYGFVKEYTERDYLAVDRTRKDQEDKARRLVEDAKAALCGLELLQRFDRKESQLRLHTAAEPPSALAGDKVIVSLCPLGMVERFPGELPGLAAVFSSDGLSFRDCHVSALTEFVVCHIEPLGDGGGIAFVIKTTVDFLDLMDLRDSELRKHILSKTTPEDLLRLILFGRARPPRPGTSGSGTGKGRKGTWGLSHILGENVAIEDVMRACTEDPDRIAEVSRFLDDLHGSDVDPAFVQFWKAFTDAASEAGMRNETWR